MSAHLRKWIDTQTRGHLQRIREASNASSKQCALEAYAEFLEFVAHVEREAAA